MENSQDIKIENRNNIQISGVNNVKSFDSNEFILDTKLGELKILGSDLTLGKMDLNTKEVLIKGTLNSLEYTNVSKDKESLIKRLFK